MKKLNKLWPILAVLVIVATVLALSGFVGYEVYNSFGDDITTYGKLVSVVAAFFVAAFGFLGVHEWLSR